MVLDGVSAESADKPEAAMNDVSLRTGQPRVWMTARS